MKFSFKVKHKTTALLTIIFGVVVLLLSYFDIYILRCIPKLITGYDCPFCGTQRVLSSILHGNFKAAFHLNPYLFFVSPYIIIVILCLLNVFPKGSKVQKIAYSTPVLILAGIVTITWWILRNTTLLNKILIFAGA